MPKIEASVGGIPCQAELTFYRPGDPGCLFGPPERCYPPEPPEVEYELLDRKGYPAAWLQRKVTAEDHEAIVEALLAQIGAAREDEATARAENRAERLGWRL